MLVVVTRLVPRPDRIAPATELSGQVLTRLAGLSGCCGGWLLVDDAGVFWTMTGWTDAASLAAFRADHQLVMAQLADVAADSGMTAFTAVELPGWGDATTCWPGGIGPVGGRPLPVPASAELASAGPADDIQQRGRPGGSRALAG